MSTPPKKIGRPATGTDQAVTTRFPADVLQAVERCVDGDAIRNRSEAVRQIVTAWLRANQMLPEQPR